MKFKNKVIVFASAAVLLMLAAFSLGFNPASNMKMNEPLLVKQDTSGNTIKYSFSTRENGEKIYWRALVRNGKIVSLYRDGEKLSDKETEKYEDMVYGRIKDLDYNLTSFDFNIPDVNVHFDSEKFKGQMEKLKEKIKNMKPMNFNFKFDRDKFRKQMEKMKENLKDMHDCDFFDEEAVEKAMEVVNKNLENLPKNIHVDIDADALAESMENIRINLKDLKIDMNGLREKMKQLKGFLKEMKSELVKDGYLDEDDENFDMEFTKDRLKINGERLPDNLLEKYKKLYNDHFGKEPNDTFRICN